MRDAAHLLGSAPAVPSPWYHGVRVSEAAELLLALTLFIGVLAAVYFIQRWIGDD